MIAVSLRPVRKQITELLGGFCRFLCYFSLGTRFGLSKEQGPIPGRGC
jgi:hypothetical protein